MTLSELIKEYRQSHGLSQRAFGERCGVSTGYISLIEKGVNPKTGEPLIPQLPQLAKIACGMGLTLSELSMSIDDVTVNIRSNKKSATVAGDELSAEEKAFIDWLRALPPEKRQAVLHFQDMF